MEMIMERISFSFDPRDMLLSLKIGFSFVQAAVAFAILESLVWIHHLEQLLQGTLSVLRYPASTLLP